MKHLIHRGKKMAPKLKKKIKTLYLLKLKTNSFHPFGHINPWAIHVNDNSQSFCFHRSGLGPENVHFCQALRYC